MKKPPTAVVIIAALYILAGSVGLVYHAREWSSVSRADNQILWISAVRALAVVAGIFLLAGRNWARALAVMWIGFHVVIGAMDDVVSLLIHAMLMVIILQALFAPKSEAFFSGKAVES